MQLTRAADYAVRVMIYLATLPPGVRVNRDLLARTTEVPAHFLAKVLQSLVRARLIVAHRGVNGGFSLAVPAWRVSLLRIVETIEGPIQLNICMSAESGCSRQPWCPAHPVWVEAQQALTRVLQNASIARLASEAGASPKAQVIQPWN